MAIKMNEIKKMTYDKDIRGMKENELNEALGVAVKNANRKLGQWRKEDEFRGYVKNFLKDKKLNKNGNITTEGLTDQQKRKLLYDLVRFSNAKQSSVKGESKVASKIGQRLGINYNDLTEDQRKLFWQIYEKFKERNSDMFKYDDLKSVEKAMEVQRKIASIKGVFLTKEGNIRKIWGDKSVEKSVEELEKALGIKKSATIMAEQGAAAKTKMMDNDELDERKATNVLKK